jgi:hypothetical protein
MVLQVKSFPREHGFFFRKSPAKNHRVLYFTIVIAPTSTLISAISLVAPTQSPVMP